MDLHHTKRIRSGKEGHWSRHWNLFTPVSSTPSIQNTPLSSQSSSWVVPPHTWRRKQTRWENTFLSIFCPLFSGDWSWSQCFNFCIWLSYLHENKTNKYIYIMNINTLFQFILNVECVWSSLETTGSCEQYTQKTLFISHFVWSTLMKLLIDSGLTWSHLSPFSAVVGYEVTVGISS